jgi:hypothetical protein
VFHASRSLLGAQFRDFDTFLAPRRGCPRFFACAPNEPAKRFAGDIEAGIGESLSDLLLRFSRAQRGFDSGQKRTEEGGFRGGWFSGQFLQGLTVEISVL